MLMFKNLQIKNQNLIFFYQLKLNFKIYLPLLIIIGKFDFKIKEKNKS